MMAGQRILNDTQIEEMCALREMGWGIRRIADYFTKNGTPISAGAVNWQCLRMGADTLPKFQGQHTQPSTPYARGGHVVRPFTPEDDALLRVLDMQGFPLPIICQRLNRKNNSVRGRLLTLARIDARKEAREGVAA